MATLTVTKESFTAMILGIIQSGVTFEAKEQGDGSILITFLGGY